MHVSGIYKIFWIKYNGWFAQFLIIVIICYSARSNCGLLIDFRMSFSSRDARNMARDVQTVFYEIAEELGGMTRSQATDYIKKLMTKGRYSQDVWS